MYVLIGVNCAGLYLYLTRFE